MEMMTRRKAERIMQLSVWPPERYRRWTANLKAIDEYGEVLCESEAELEVDALALLVERNYYRVRDLVFTRDKYRCVYCGSRSNLQAHHKRFRSHGREDVEGNLATCCPACHDAQHSLRRHG